MDLIDNAGRRMQTIEFLSAGLAWWRDEFEKWLVYELMVCGSDHQSSSGQTSGCGAAIPAVIFGKRGRE
jgi:hypothetical protein